MQNTIYWKKILASLVLLLLLGFTLYCGFLIQQQEQDLSILKKDMAELSHIRYGLLSIDEWENKLTRILAKKIREYKFSDENRAEMREKISALIAEMIDIISTIIRENNQQEGGFSGWLKNTAFNSLINVEALKADAPQIAETLLKYLEKPENQQKVQRFIADQIHAYASETLGTTDYRKVDQILIHYAAVNGADAVERIGYKIENLNFSVNRLGLLFLIACIPLVLAAFSRAVDQQFSLLLLLTLALTTLYLGTALPMIDIDARIGNLTFQLVGETIRFQNQVLFFQSKSILEVIEILFTRGDGKLALVGGLIFLFSVLFPLTKILLSSSWLLHSATRQRNHVLVRFFVFRSGKWSMADVMVVAIFMAYLGFSGVIDSQLEQLNRTQENLQVLTTSHSELQIGFYFFTGFCLLGLLISQLIAGLEKKR